MSRIAEIEDAVARIRARCELTILQCTSEYPCRPERLGLNLIPVFRRRFGCNIGLSDHSGTIFAGLAAAAFGIDVLVVHVTFSREMFGPDVKASITTAELRQLVEGIRFIERARWSHISKDQMASELSPLRSIFSKSIAARTDLAAGSKIEAADLILRKPGTGIPADRMAGLIGRTLSRAVRAGEFFSDSDFAAVELAEARV